MLPEKRPPWQVPRPSGHQKKERARQCPTEDASRRSQTPAEPPRPPKLCLSRQDGRPPSEELLVPRPSGCLLGPASAKTGSLDHSIRATLWPGLGSRLFPPLAQATWVRRLGIGAGVGQIKSGALAMVSHVLHTPQRADAPRASVSVASALSVRCWWLRGGC